jgi:hypothetical protein
MVLSVAWTSVISGSHALLVWEGNCRRLWRRVAGRAACMSWLVA